LGAVHVIPPAAVEVIFWPSSGGEFHTQRRRAIKMCETASQQLGLRHTYFSEEENMPSTTTIVVVVVVIAVAIFGFSGGLPF
ncbi:hypothetical protein, partial [Halomonas sp. 707B3]